MYDACKASAPCAKAPVHVGVEICSCCSNLIGFLTNLLRRIFARIFGFFYKFLHSYTMYPTHFTRICLDSHKIFLGRISARMDSRILAKFLTLYTQYVACSICTTDLDHEDPDPIQFQWAVWSVPVLNLNQDALWNKCNRSIAYFACASICT